jgi:phage gp46-like protein
MDISSRFNNSTGWVDWLLSGPDLQLGTEIYSAVLISLFTDRIAGADDKLTDGSDNRRGWWGDLAQDVPIGSRLWLLAREKQVGEVLARAHDYALEALQWLITDGLVLRFDITVSFLAAGQIGFLIVAYQPDGRTEQMNFALKGLTNAL